MKLSRWHSCQISDCEGKAVWWIEYKTENRKKNVCSKCRDEMIALFGWKLLNW